MSKRLIIEKDNTVLQKSYFTPKGRISFRKNGEMPTSTFLNKIMREKRSVLLPQNTRYYKDYGESKLFVTEHPPQLRTIRIATNVTYKWKGFLTWCEKNNIKDGQQFFKGFGGKGLKVHSFNVLFPYMVCLTMFSKHSWYYLYVFLTSKPIDDLGNMLYKVPLSNIQRSQAVCMGGSVRVPDSNIFRMEPSIAVDLVFRGFFEGSFNSDYRYNLYAYQYRPKLYNYFIWSYLSHNDPMQILKQELIEYQPLDQTIEMLECKYGYERDVAFFDVTGVF